MPRPDRIMAPGRLDQLNAEWAQHVAAVRDRNNGRRFAAENVFQVEPDLIGYYVLGDDGEVEIVGGEPRRQFRHGEFEIEWKPDAPEDLP